MKKAILLFLLPLTVQAQFGGGDDVFSDEPVDAYYYDVRWHASGSNNNGNAYEQNWRCGAAFAASAGEHCYVETLAGIAGWRKGNNHNWILFLSIVDPAAVYRPHLIQPDDITGRPYAGTVVPITNPTVPPPALCLSAFSCPY